MLSMISIARSTVMSSETSGSDIAEMITLRGVRRIGRLRLSGKVQVLPLSRKRLKRRTSYLLGLSCAGRCGAGANDEFTVQDALGDRAVVLADFVVEECDRVLAELVERLAQRRQRRRQMRGAGRIIDGDNRQVLR